ncbi:hypothetical protein FPZ43_11240 [Mucilaginibacter pallidiroseus]|uniref:HTH cro/C1-type domain-containing protein n=1 Tax=Mucilaginibacter pallidiroseus TaxID=2599295 RepID=A0A563UBU8_9SPHI|nr:hypothetical protein [Mucilaginibacter pallidiroseus]TWR28837.1 hypothetical protein FPZ43_11240 [Mucilaginibacter pallidiroseus]
MNNYHHGQLVEYTIRKNGYNLTDLANKLNVNRRTIYNWFQQPNLKISIIIAIGNVIRHDFSQDLPGILEDKDFSFNRPVVKSYNKSNENDWMDKYLTLLEQYNKVLTAMVDDQEKPMLVM